MRTRPSGFEKLLDYAWSQEFIGKREIWISQVDNLFHIECGPKERDFTEIWINKFPHHEGTYAFPVFLKVQGVEIKQLTFIAIDGARILVPMPEINIIDNKSEFKYFKNSLPYKVGQIIGQFDVYETLNGVARLAGIELF